MRDAQVVRKWTNMNMNDTSPNVDDGWSVLQ